MRKNKKSQLPLLPPEVGEDEIEVSDEDVNFVQKNKRFAGFLTSLDTNSITKQVVRLSDDQNGDALESYYEKRLKKNSSLGEGDNSGLKVDPVDVLPVKTLSGKLYYKTGKFGHGKTSARRKITEGKVGHKSGEFAPARK
eukprot:Gb_30924 [translate_table: standard]